MQTNNQDLIKQADIQAIALKGATIYERLRAQYEPGDNGKFLAIDVESERAYIGTTSAEALDSARQQHPERIFYVVKVGFQSAETLAHSFLEASR